MSGYGYLAWKSYKNIIMYIASFVTDDPIKYAVNRWRFEFQFWNYNEKKGALFWGKPLKILYGSPTLHWLYSLACDCWSKVLLHWNLLKYDTIKNYNQFMPKSYELMGVIHKLRWQDKVGRWYWICQRYADFPLSQ